MATPEQQPEDEIGGLALAGTATAGHVATVKASVFCKCDSFCVSAFSLGQGSRSFCHELCEQSTVMFCESGRVF